MYYKTFIYFILISVFFSCNVSLKKPKNHTRDLMNFLQYADGKNSLDDISKLIKLSLSKTKKIYLLLKKNSLVD